MTQDKPLAICRFMDALAIDCENTDGWEAAAPDCRKAAEVINVLVEALEGMVAAVKADAKANGGISGFTGARLSDAEAALKKAGVE